MLGRKLFFCPLLLSGTLAWSQAQPTQSISKPRVDVFASYIYGSGNENQAGGGILAGIDLARIYRKVGLTVEFDRTSASSPPSSSNATSEWNVLAGPRYTFPVAASSRVASFADALIGTETFHNAGQNYTWTYNNHTSLAWALDGGLDLRLSRHFAVRVQAGFLGTSLTYSTSGGPVSPATTFSGRARAGGGLVARF
jgi:hypothetical protein